MFTAVCSCLDDFLPSERTAAEQHEKFYDFKSYSEKVYKYLIQNIKEDALLVAKPRVENKNYLRLNWRSRVNRCYVLVALHICVVNMCVRVQAVSFGTT